MEKFKKLANGDTLIDHIAHAQENYRMCHKEGYGIPFESEELLWAIQDWHSMFGGFTENEKKYLQDEWDISEQELKEFAEVE